MTRSVRGLPCSKFQRQLMKKYVIVRRVAAFPASFVGNLKQNHRATEREPERVEISIKSIGPETICMVARRSQHGRISNVYFDGWGGSVHDARLCLVRMTTQQHLICCNI